MLWEEDIHKYIIVPVGICGASRVNSLHAQHRVSLKLDDGAVELRGFDKHVGEELVDFAVGFDVEGRQTDGELPLCRVAHACWVTLAEPDGVR